MSSKVPLELWPFAFCRVFPITVLHRENCLSDTFLNILILIFTNASVLALLTLLLKGSFEGYLNKRAKLFERELELMHKKSFHQFSKVYDEQAVTLREIYAQLVALNDQAAGLAFHYSLVEQHPELLERYRTPKTGDAASWDRFLKATLADKPEDLKADVLYQQAMRTLAEFRPKRIYLPAKTASEVERLMTLFVYVGSEFRNVSNRDSDDLQLIVAPEVIEVWKKAVLASQQLFPILEAQFREHLGAEPAN